MGLSYAEAERLNIAHEHPDHPSRRGQAVPSVEIPSEPKRRKYGNVPTVYKGVRYDSKGEANHAAKLDADLDAGLIRAWFRQVPVTLGLPECKVRVDFLVIGHQDAWFDEFKGKDTPKWLRDVKLWRKYGPLRLNVVRRGRVLETIGPAARATGTTETP